MRTETLRPTKLDDIVGQDELKEKLKIVIRSSIIRCESLPHMLFDGPPGLGKTSFAFAVANEVDAPVQTANGAHLRSPKNILPYLFKISEGSILFIDEIHRMTKPVAELLYTVLEDFKIYLTNKEETVNIDIPPFTMIGATTESGSLPRALYSRFPFCESLKFYTEAELLKLVEINADKLNVQLTLEAGKKVAAISKGTPRILNHRLGWVRDFGLANGINLITEGVAKDAFDKLGITDEGLDWLDVKYLDVLKTSFKGGPVGIEGLASVMGIEAPSIKNNIEPYLLKLGKIARTKKGRILCQ